MFGDYVEVHEENVKTKLMIPRTRPAICMGPSGDIQASIKFMCINTGKKIVRRNYTRLPMSESVMRKVEEVAEKQ